MQIEVRKLLIRKKKARQSFFCHLIVVAVDICRIVTVALSI